MKNSDNNEYARGRSQGKGIKRTMILVLKAFALVFLVSGLGLAVCVAFLSFPAKRRCCSSFAGYGLYCSDVPIGRRK